METQATDHLGSDEGLPHFQAGSLVCGLCLTRGLAHEQVIESWTGSFLEGKVHDIGKAVETDQMGSFRRAHLESTGGRFRRFQEKRCVDGDGL